MLPFSLQCLLTSLLWPSQPPVESNQLTFQLRHVHAVAESDPARVIFNDVPQSLVASASGSGGYTLSTKPLLTHKPHSFEAHAKARHRSLFNFESSNSLSLWNEQEVNGPDVSNLDTLITLAEMTSNSYFKPSDKTWYDLGPDWNQSFPFGWEPGQTGTRGHVFASTDNKTIAVSIKGTSIPIIGGGPTVPEDKLNDNLLFSCCCARVGPTWSTVCPCYAGSGKCNQNCLEQSLIERSLFYNVATNLYNNITYMYPDSNIWVIGHSLGGSLASLIGVTFGAPVVTFEAVGEKLAASRLHLPSPPSTQHITHVYNTADPIPMGTCTGIASPCAVAGYALETKCHLGKSIILDTITVLGWSSSIQNHGIRTVIDNVLNITDVDWGNGTTSKASRSTPGQMATLWWPWGPGKGGDPAPKQPKVPEAVEEKDCVDCYSWDYGDY